MPVRPLFRLLVTLLSLATVLAACTAAPAPVARPPAASAVATTGGMLRLGAPTPWPDTLDPQKSGGSEIVVERLNYEGLTRLDRDLRAVPAAAERWVYAADGQSVTFFLRANLRYSDGSPLTADAFAGAARRTLDPRDPGAYQTALKMIAGAEALIATAVPTDEAQLPARFQQLGIVVPDDRTITFHFTRPTPYFHTLAALWIMYPAKPALVARGGATWYADAANQLGNGPFQIAQLDQTNSRIVLRANQHYWQGRPRLDAIEIRFVPETAVALQAYRGDELDAIAPGPGDIPAILADPILSREYHELPGVCTSGFGFNVTRPPFDDARVRAAFALALDRAAFVRDVMSNNGMATLSWIARGSPGYDAEERRFAFDPAAARRQLDAAGYADRASLPPIALAYDSGDPFYRTMSEYVAQQFEQNLGVALNLDPYESATLFHLGADPITTPQMMVRTWCADYPDPQNWLSLYWHSSSNIAHGYGYQNTTVDRLLDAADAATDGGRRAALYAQAQRLVVGDVPVIPVLNNRLAFLIKPYVKGIVLTSQDGLPGDITGEQAVTITR